MAQSSDSFNEDEIREKIEDYKKKRKEMAATSLIGMFGIYILLPFTSLLLVLAIVSFGIAPSMFVYYTWKKRQLEKELEKSDFDDEIEDFFGSWADK